MVLGGNTMKRSSILIILALALALGCGALAVAQEPDQAGDQPIAAPRPQQPDAGAQPSPLAAELDKALKAGIAREGRAAIAAKAKPLREANASDCFTADEYENLSVLLTEACVAQVKKTLAEPDGRQ
jgi:hypothetical protein